MKEFTINDQNRSIEMTKSLEKKAGTYHSEAYKELVEVCNDFFV